LSAFHWVGPWVTATPPESRTAQTRRCHKALHKAKRGPPRTFERNNEIDSFGGRPCPRVHGRVPQNQRVQPSLGECCVGLPRQPCWQRAVPHALRSLPHSQPDPTQHGENTNDRERWNMRDTAALRLAQARDHSTQPMNPASVTEQEHRYSTNRVACVCVQTRAHDANGYAVVARQSAREHMEAVSTRRRTATLTFRRRTPTACRHTLETASSPTQTLQSTPQQTRRSLASRMAHGNASQPAGRTTATSSFDSMQRSWRQPGGLVESLRARRPTAAHAA
jgi:hypothetical protein